MLGWINLIKVGNGQVGLFFPKTILNYLTKILRQNEKPVWKTTPNIYNCFYKLGRCLDESIDHIPHSKFNLIINELLLELLSLFKKGEVKLDASLPVNLRTVEIFLKHLHDDFERHWALEDMAEHCGLGVTSLTKYCKQLTNMTPVNYLISIRLEAAAKMLGKDNEKNVTEVGYDCGFSSSQYFATTFRKQYKCSPSDYRINIAARKVSLV